MAIKKIIFDDGSEKEFIPELPKYIDDKTEIKWRTNRQLIRWEQEEILPNLLTDIEDYAKQNYDLIDEDEKDDISDFDDDDLIMEAEKRKLHLRNASIKNENIINENYLDRFAEIINRGNDIEIGNFLYDLEVKYHIK